jgi:hypothetical protein
VLLLAHLPCPAIPGTAAGEARLLLITPEIGFSSADQILQQHQVLRQPVCVAIAFSLCSILCYSIALHRETCRHTQQVTPPHTVSGPIRVSTSADLAPPLVTGRGQLGPGANRWGCLQQNAAAGGPHGFANEACWLWLLSPCCC